MECFIDEMPERFRDELECAIRGRGAFRRFKGILARLGVLEDWYTYLSAAYRKEVRGWCDLHGIPWWKDMID